MDVLTEEVATLRRSREKVFKSPPIEWISGRIERLKELLQRRIPHSAHVIRNLLGTIRLEPVRPDIGRPFYRAVRNLDALALIEEPPRYCGGRFEFIS